MGTKRKVEKASTIVKEVNMSNVSPQTAGKQNMRSRADRNANAKQVPSVGNSLHQDSNLLAHKEKTSTPTNVDVRRSVRFKKSASSTAESVKIKPDMEHVNVFESEKKEAAEGNQVSTSPVVTERTLEQESPQYQQLNTVLPVNETDEKVDCMVQAVDESKSLVPERQNADPCAEISYKSLYIESQKRIEELMENNFDLVRKLDFAHGKIEAYEKMMVPAKEVILVSDQGKATEATVSLSPQEVQRPISQIGAAADRILSTKRKKINSKVAADATEGHNASPKQKKKYTKRKSN